VFQDQSNTVQEVYSSPIRVVSKKAQAKKIAEKAHLIDDFNEVPAPAGLSTPKMTNVPEAHSPNKKTEQKIPTPDVGLLLAKIDQLEAHTADLVSSVRSSEQQNSQLVTALTLLHPELQNMNNHSGINTHRQDKPVANLKRAFDNFMSAIREIAEEDRPSKIRRLVKHATDEDVEITDNFYNMFSSALQTGPNDFLLSPPHWPLPPQEESNLYNDVDLLSVETLDQLCEYKEDTKQTPEELIQMLTVQSHS